MNWVLVIVIAIIVFALGEVERRGLLKLHLLYFLQS